VSFLNISHLNSGSAGPAITSVSPASISAGTGTFIITVTGSGFVSGDVVLWNGIALPTTFISSTELQASVISSLIAQSGPVSIIVSGSGLASAASGSTVGPSVTPSANIYYFPHLAFGGAWQTTLTYVNYSPQSVTCQTAFYSDTGAPLPVPFPAATSSTRTDYLAAGAGIHDQTQAAIAAQLLTGWAEAQCNGPIKASLLYRLYNGAVAQGEAGVNAVTAGATEFVSFAQTATGIAYANSSSTSATITITALNAAGLALDPTNVVLPPNQHGQANIGPLLGLNSFTGSVQVTSTVPILTLLLNAEAFPAFSSLPPADLPAGTPLAP
jgi:hypothetical protein